MPLRDLIAGKVDASGSSFVECLSRRKARLRVPPIDDDPAGADQQKARDANQWLLQCLPPVNLQHAFNGSGMRVLIRFLNLNQQIGSLTMMWKT